MAKVVDHYKVVIKHTDGTWESGWKAKDKPPALNGFYHVWREDEVVIEKLITLANVVSVSVTPVFRQ